MSAEAAEKTLVSRLREGDEAAFLALVDRHQAALTRLARTFVASPAAADEVVQETWAALVAGLEAFEERSSLKTWLFRVCANRARTKGVREARSVPFSALADADSKSPAHDPSEFQADGHWATPPADWSETPETALLRREALERLATALETLPPAQRAVVTLRDVEGLSSDEVCNVLELSETNQRVLLHRARVKLRAALADLVEEGA